MELLITRMEDGPPRTLHIGGEIDLATFEEFRDVLEAALTGASTTLVDMSDVTFIDAAGLRVILRVAASPEVAHPLTLVNAPAVARLLKVIGMGDVSCVQFQTGE